MRKPQAHRISWKAGGEEVRRGGLGSKGRLSRGFSDLQDPLQQRAGLECRFFPQDAFAPSLGELEFNTVRAPLMLIIPANGTAS